MSGTKEDTKPNNVEPSNKLRTSKNVTVAFKLNGKNYSLWSRLMKVAIGSRGAYSHITGKPKPPEPDSEEYAEWEETDLIVFSWIVDNIETDIIADFAHHQMAKAIWDNLAVTFESTADPYLVYDLEEKVNAITQGSPDLETYYRRLHGLWINVDRCQKQPIDCCDKGVSQFRQHANTKQVFKFLAGLSEVYDGIRRDILKETPLPSVEAVYGWVKREAARRKIMPPASPSPAVEANGNADSSSGGIGYGFGAQSHRQSNRSAPPRPTAATYRPGNKPDKTKLWCSHCGMQKHTRDTCFQIVGYPEWWEEKQKARAKLAAVAIEEAGGRPPASGTGGREGRNGRGKPTEASSDVSTGGGNVRASNFAERMEGVGEMTDRGGGGKWSGGKGFGHPSPKSPTYLHKHPPYFALFHKRPHIITYETPQSGNYHARAQKFDYCTKTPTLLTKN